MQGFDKTVLLITEMCLFGGGEEIKGFQEI